MYLKLSITKWRDNEEEKGKVIKWVIPNIRADVMVYGNGSVSAANSQEISI